MIECFRLARFYSTSPDHFLGKRLSELRKLAYWSDRLLAEWERQPGRQ